MKRVLLSFSVLFLLLTNATAQQVTVVNNTGCPLEVTVTGWNLCAPTANPTTPPSSPYLMPAGPASETFFDAGALEDFTVRVEIPGLGIVFGDVRAYPNSCIAATVPVSSTDAAISATTPPCLRGSNGIMVTQQPPSTFLNGLIIVQPY